MKNLLGKTLPPDTPRAAQGHCTERPESSKATPESNRNTSDRLLQETFSQSCARDLPWLFFLKPRRAFHIVKTNTDRRLALSLPEALGAPPEDLQNASGDPVKVLWERRGSPLGNLEDAIGTPCDALGDTLGRHGDALGELGDAFGRPVRILGCLGDALGAPRVDFLVKISVSPRRDAFFNFEIIVLR